MEECNSNPIKPFDYDEWHRHMVAAFDIKTVELNCPKHGMTEHVISGFNNVKLCVKCFGERQFNIPKYSKTSREKLEQKKIDDGKKYLRKFEW